MAEINFHPTLNIVQSERLDYLTLLNDAWDSHLAPRKENAPTVISLFAGCGGSSLGYSMAGYKELLAVEWNDNAVATFTLNFPDIPIYHGDINNLSVDETLSRTGFRAGELFVLDGSPPCQGFSSAGKRDMNDDRNKLFKQYARLLQGLQPKFFVMENVSGLVKGKMKLIFVEILKELKACGYVVKVRLMNTKYFNVPQSRERLIFIGIRNDIHVDLSNAKTSQKIFTVRDALTGLSEISQDENSNHVWIDEVQRQTKWIGRAAVLKQGEQMAFQYRRLYWDKPCPTITKGSFENMPCYVRGSNIHPTQPRTLSIRELARCHSFPDQFRFVNALRNGSQCIGNSVPPLFMKAIAESFI